MEAKVCAGSGQQPASHFYLVSAFDESHLVLNRLAAASLGMSSPLIPTSEKLLLAFFVSKPFDYDQNCPDSSESFRHNPGPTWIMDADT
jgi:hypothetical protein